MLFPGPVSMPSWKPQLETSAYICLTKMDDTIMPTCNGVQYQEGIVGVEGESPISQNWVVFSNTLL